MRIAINGFGRIGRMVFRELLDREHLDVVAINDLTDPKTLAHLLKYDSVHGKLIKDVAYDDSHLIIDGNSIPVYKEKDPELLPWKEKQVDVVVESTGIFLKKDLASKHLKAGAKKVVLSAPAKSDDIKTVVIGINEHTITSDDDILSNASCTTNCFAPIVKVLHDNFGIRKGYMATTHAYTADQRLVDAPHRDLRRARSAAVNIVPTTSGAAKAVKKVLPEVGDCLHSMAIRVPVPDGSMIYFIAELNKEVSSEEVNDLFNNVANHHLKNVIEYSEDPLVSSDIVGNKHSAIFDAQQTEVDGHMLKIMAWYDNEVGYSTRTVDLIELLK